MRLSRPLRLWDIVLLNVTAIIGLRWISLAATGGFTSLLLWLAALLFFFLPQAFAVIELTRRLPGEGGIYLWTKSAFGDFHGFFSAWCYWTNNLVYFPNLLVYMAGISVFVAGSAHEATGQDRLFVILFSLSVLWAVAFFNFLGLRLGKWVNNVGGIGTWLTGSILILFGLFAVMKFGVANPISPGSFTEGIFTFHKISFWAAICFGFTGLELASVLAGEVKNPRKSIPRAVIISGFIIGGIYIVGTLSLLVALPAGNINIISGFLQGIAAIGRKLGLGWTSNILAFLITLGGIGGLMAWFTGAARMPFVAGIDRFLPEGFGKIHPKYRSPHVAILVQTVIATMFIVMSFVGATVREAYLILLDTTLLIYFVPYGYMFLSFAVLRARSGGRSDAVRIPRKNPLAYFVAASGLATTLLAMIITVIPPEDAGNALLYEIKVVGGFLLFVMAGGLIFKRASVKR